VITSSTLKDKIDYSELYSKIRKPIHIENVHLASANSGHSHEIFTDNVTDILHLALN